MYRPLLVALLLALGVFPASADGTDNVQVLMSPILVESVACVPSSFDFGSLNLSASDASRTTADSANITCTNDGNSTVDVSTYGQNASPANVNHAIWTISCLPAENGTVGANQFVLQFDATSPVDFVDAKALCTNTGAKSIKTGLATGASFAYQLRLAMPTATTGFSQRSLNQTLLSIAP